VALRADGAKYFVSKKLPVARTRAAVLREASVEKAIVTSGVGGLQRMKRLAVLAMVFLPLIAWAESAHTPKPGSAERKAVCDAMRAFVKAHEAPREILFKVDQMLVLGKYCYFKGYAVFADGSGIPEGYLPDVVYNTFLKREESGWKVLLDLTRTDVPSEPEVNEIRRRFPEEIPRQIVPRFWKDMLNL
jgi:hypothetical protein